MSVCGICILFCCFLPLGLEYLIEIQHNTLKKMPNNYCCLLCDADIKVKKDPVDTVDLAKNHLKSTGHKLKYLVSLLASRLSLLFLNLINSIYSLSIFQPSKEFILATKIHRTKVCWRTWWIDSHCKMFP